MSETHYHIDHDVELLVVGTWSDNPPTPAQKAQLREAYRKTMTGINAAETLITQQAAKISAARERIAALEDVLREAMIVIASNYLLVCSEQCASLTEAYCSCGADDTRSVATKARALLDVAERNGEGGGSEVSK